MTGAAGPVAAEAADGLPSGERLWAMLAIGIAMSMAVAGLVSTAGVDVDDTSPIATSFPNFLALLAEIGA